MEATSVCLLFTLAKHIPSRSKLPSTHRSPQAARGFQASRNPAENTAPGRAGFLGRSGPSSPPTPGRPPPGRFPSPVAGLADGHGEADENLPSPAQTPAAPQLLSPTPSFPSWTTWSGGRVTDQESRSSHAAGRPSQLPTGWGRCRHRGPPAGRGTGKPAGSQAVGASGLCS